MAKKKFFYPLTEGMTKDDIFRRCTSTRTIKRKKQVVFLDTNPPVTDDNEFGDQVYVPVLFKAKDITDNDAQCFVDEIQIIHEENGDSGMEEDATIDYIADFMRDINERVVREKAKKKKKR